MASFIRKTEFSRIVAPYISDYDYPGVINLYLFYDSIIKHEFFIVIQRVVDNLPRHVTVVVV